MPGPDFWFAKGYKPFRHCFVLNSKVNENSEVKECYYKLVCEGSKKAKDGVLRFSKGFVVFR